MNGKKLESTKLLKSNIVEWKEQFIKNCEELGDVPFYKCDVGNVNALWKLKLEGEADARSLEKTYGFACIPYVFWNKAMIGFFLRQGCSVNAKDKYGMTALHYAVRYLWVKNDDVMQFLLKNGADAKIRDDNDLIPIVQLPPILLTSKQPQSIQLFQKLSGTRTFSPMQLQGETLLHLAVEILGCESMQKFLCNFRGNVDVRNESGKTPFMVALKYTKYDICELLLDKGADVNAQDEVGYTALHHAVYDKILNGINFLMSNNADPNIRSSSGRDVYEMACLVNKDFTEGAKPSKLIQIHEMKGAFAILGKHNYEEGLFHWKEALDMCSKHKLKPSLELLSNYELVKKHEKSDDKFKLDLYRAAIRTMDRISTGPSKLWNILSAAVYEYKHIHPFSICFRITDEEFMEILKLITDKMMYFNGEDFVSTEDIDFYSFVDFVYKLYNLIEKSADFCFILNFFKFAETCFSKWIQNELLGYILPCGAFDLNYKTLEILMRIQTDDPSSEEWIAEETRNLIKNIVKLDPIQPPFGNTLLHFVCKYWDRELIEVMIDSGANVQSVNAENQTPIQLIYSEKFQDEQNLRVIKKMIERGSPVNATTRNVDGKLIEDLLAKYTL